MRHAYQRAAGAMLLLVLTLFALMPLVVGASSRATAPVAQTANDWRVGSIVRLSKGTQIRQGPGTRFCFHTIVPEDDWAVMVTGGPRDADNITWYDTSRREAGDPSGGTGWVNIQQVDSRPVPNDGGNWCPGFPLTTPVTQTVTPPDDPDDPECDERPGDVIKVPQPLLDSTSWWKDQSIYVKLGALALAVVLLSMSGRLTVLGGPVLQTLVRAVLLGVILAGVADLTRPVWAVTWRSITNSVTNRNCDTGIDPALVLLVTPLAWWGFSLVARVASKLVSIVALAVLLMLVLFFVAPDRFNDILREAQAWFGRLGR